MDEEAEIQESRVAHLGCEAAFFGCKRMNEYAIIVFWSDEDRVWIAEAPDLKPCAAHGGTPEAAVAELRVVMEGWLAVARERGLPIPPARFQAPADATE